VIRVEKTDKLAKIFGTIEGKVGFETADAHCDYPCGIYDPHLAQLSALTVVRMVDLLKTIPKPNADKVEDMLDYAHDVARAVEVKEKHAELCKHEIRIIWGDYIKPDHLKAHPELHEIVFNIMKFGGKSKQEPDRDAAMKLLNEVNKFSEIFWETKGIKTKRAKAPYDPHEEVVYPQL
jgi:nickel superoxide dismutase